MLIATQLTIKFPTPFQHKGLLLYPFQYYHPALTMEKYEH
jgi:hypothetical protein